MRRLLFIGFRRRSALVAGPALAANPQVELDTTAGTIKLELYPDAAPKTVENFLDYVKAGHYDGTQFHRVIEGFMIQGGGYDAEFKAEADAAADRDRVGAERQGRPVERAGHGRDGAHRRSELGDVAVLHQRRRQQAARLPLGRPARLRLHGVRQGRRRHGRGRQDRQGRRPAPADRFPTDVPAERVVIKSARVVDAAS